MLLLALIYRNSDSERQLPGCRAAYRSWSLEGGAFGGLGASPVSMDVTKFHTGAFKGMYREIYIKINNLIKNQIFGFLLHMRDMDELRGAKYSRMLH